MVTLFSASWIIERIFSYRGSPRVSGPLTMISMVLGSLPWNSGTLLIGLWTSPFFRQANAQSASNIAESCMTAGPSMRRLKSLQRFGEWMGPMYSFPMLRPPIITRFRSKMASFLWFLRLALPSDRKGKTGIKRSILPPAFASSNI